jgi:hypothetical protein
VLARKQPHERRGSGRRGCIDAGREAADTDPVAADPGG